MKKLFVFLILLFISCSVSKDEAISLDIGDKIPNSAIDKNMYYITTSSQAEEVYSYEENNITFDVMTDRKGYITFLKPTDNSFQTPCGIKVGDSLVKVQKISQKKLKKMPGWGYFISLSHGWFARFEDNKYIKTEGRLSVNTKVVFLFKSKYHGSWYD